MLPSYEKKALLLFLIIFGQGLSNDLWVLFDPFVTVLSKMSFPLPGCLLWLRFILRIGTKDRRKEMMRHVSSFPLKSLAESHPIPHSCSLVSWMVNSDVSYPAVCVNHMHLCCFKNFWGQESRVLTLYATCHFALLYWYDNWDRLVYVANPYGISYLHHSLHSHSEVYKSWQW